MKPFSFRWRGLTLLPTFSGNYRFQGKEDQNWYIEPSTVGRIASYFHAVTTSGAFVPRLEFSEDGFAVELIPTYDGQFLLYLYTWDAEYHNDLEDALEAEEAELWQVVPTNHEEIARFVTGWYNFYVLRT